MEMNCSKPLGRHPKYPHLPAMHPQRRLSDLPHPTKTLPPSLLGNHMTWPIGIVARRTICTIVLLPILRTLTTSRNCPYPTSLSQTHRRAHPTFNPIRNHITCPRTLCRRRFHLLSLTRSLHLRTHLFLQLCILHCILPRSRILFHKVVSYPSVNIRQQYRPTTRLPAFYLFKGTSRNHTCRLLLPRTVPRVYSYGYRRHGRRDLLAVPSPTQTIVDQRLPGCFVIGALQRSNLLSSLSQISKDCSTGAGQQGRTRRRFVS